MWKGAFSVDGLMETVEIREDRADFHRSHKPGKKARRRLVDEGWCILPESCISESAKTTEAGDGKAGCS